MTRFYEIGKKDCDSFLKFYVKIKMTEVSMIITQ